MWIPECHVGEEDWEYQAQGNLFACMELGDLYILHYACTEDN